MNESIGQHPAVDVEETLARLEQRLARVELILGLDAVPQRKATFPAGEPVSPNAGSRAEVGELEAAVGQNLFANVGIMVLAIGGALVLSLPWQALPPYVPSVCGWLLAGGLFLLARWLNQSLPLIGKQCRGVGMALLFYATMRLCYFGIPPLLVPGSVAAGALMAVAVAINLAIGWRRNSVWLTGVALVTGYAAALAGGTPWGVFIMVTALTVVACLALLKKDWPWLLVLATPCSFATYLIWALGNPVVGNRLEVVTGPFAGVCLLLAWWMAMNGVAMAWRRDRTTEGPESQVGSVLNCGGYVLILAHSAICYHRYQDQDAFFAIHVVASLVLLGLAAMFWVRERSRVATFVYAMTGYAALNMALIKVTAVPDLFVWLSAQSLLVVTTAIWFRSRFIIVANFLIYLAVVTCYLVLVQKENGISLVFGLVALTSSRILKWQKDRLELKTEMMRNAYLTSAFIILPYAFYHIVPSSWVALSWVGIALFYYVMNLLTKARKYRWMGHNTLLLTVVYILIIGVGRLHGTQRIISFLVLGTVLMAVSLVFTMIRARQRRSESTGQNSDHADPPGS